MCRDIKLTQVLQDSLVSRPARVCGSSVSSLLHGKIMRNEVEECARSRKQAESGLQDSPVRGE